MRQDDQLCMTEKAMCEALNTLSDSVGRVAGVHNATAHSVLQACTSHLKQVYTLMRYRAFAQMDEVLQINSISGLPESVEISKVYQDTRTVSTGGAQLTIEKAAIIEHVLDKKRVPDAYVDKALRTAYRFHASQVNLETTVFFEKLAEEVGQHRKSYWCAWFHHVANGQLAVYLMRFELESDIADAQEILNLVSKEARSGNNTSPGIFGARVDEEIDVVYPKEVHAWFINSLVLGEDLASSLEGEWKEDEFLVYLTYERAVSTDEQSKPRGFFRDDVLRQVWETSGEITDSKRLVKRQKQIVMAPHSVLQRMHKEIAVRSLEPIVTTQQI